MASETRIRLENGEHSRVTYDESTETLYIHWKLGGFSVCRCSNNEEFQHLKSKTTLPTDAQKGISFKLSGTNP